MNPKIERTRGEQFKKLPVIFTTAKNKKKKQNE